VCIIWGGGLCSISEKHWHIRKKVRNRCIHSRLEALQSLLAKVTLNASMHLWTTLATVECYSEQFLSFYEINNSTELNGHDKISAVLQHIDFTTTRFKDEVLVHLRYLCKRTLQETATFIHPHPHTVFCNTKLASSAFRCHLLSPFLNIRCFSFVKQMYLYIF
jgi:aspartate carbamoyltransferase catalytic subunit